jgi:hypothetical protein
MTFSKKAPGVEAVPGVVLLSQIEASIPLMGLRLLELISEASL